MGDRQSVVVLEKGDWVLTEAGKVARINGMGLGKFNDLVAIEYLSDPTSQDTLKFASTLTPLPEGLNPILSDSIRTEEL